MKIRWQRNVEKSYLTIIGIVSLFLIIGCFSYAMFTLKEEKKTISIVTGTLKGELSSEEQAFKENKITVGANQEKTLTITLTNINNQDAKFNFYYVNNISDKIDISYTKDSPNIPPKESGVIIKQGESESYKLTIINTSTNEATIEFGSQAGLSKHELSFPESGHIIERQVPEEPVLSSNMIPVVYDEAEKKWEKADIKTSWYNYSKQEWANAVVTTQSSRETYQKANAGEEVKMEDILQMYVWIPRYSYTIKSEDKTNYFGKGGTSASSPGEIDVHFITKNLKEEGSAQYTGDTASGWFTPPGFTFGEKELPGVWVGKFETGYSSEAGTGKGVDNEASAQIDEVKSNNVIIKPDVYSWRVIRVSTFDLVARGMSDSGNIYGFDGIIDTHAMKNTEWALISYLTQSKYGKYGNSLYDGENKQVYINNYGSCMTGCSSGIPTASSTTTCENKYDVIEDRGKGKGQAGGGASSTGNITGIYDISGGSWEYVMGNYNKYSGYTSKSYTAEQSEALGRPKADGEAGLWNSGYSGKTGLDNLEYQGLQWPDEKYYDLYTTNVTTTACGGQPCKGHALGEFSGWYGDDALMMGTWYPWFHRGGGHASGAVAGVFCFDRDAGYAHKSISFRIVLTP